MAPFTLSSLLEDPQEFAFRTGLSFRGLTVAQNGDGWNVVLRAFDTEHRPVYALTTAEEPAEGLSRLVEALSSGNGAQLWRLDKYYKQSG